MNIRNIIICALMLLASGCTTRQVQTLTSLPLPADQSGNCCWQALQQLEIHYDKQTYKLTGALAQTREGVTLVLFDPLGRRLLSISKQGDKLNTYRSPELPEGLPERFLLASSMLVWWPLADWRAALAVDGNWQVAATGAERSLLYRGKPVIHAHYSPASVAVVEGMTGKALKDGPVNLQHEYQALSINVITQRLDSLDATQQEPDK
jgi:hypothetical protein